MNFSRTERSRIRQLNEVLRSPTVDEACCQPFQPSELDLAIRQMRSKGAPARTTYRLSFLKRWAREQKSELLEIFNCSFATGTSPQIWKRAVILPLKKAGKQPETILSYRPVSLTSCVAKTMERMIHNRFSYLAEIRGWLSPNKPASERVAPVKIKFCELRRQSVTATKLQSPSKQS